MDSVFSNVARAPEDPILGVRTSRSYFFLRFVSFPFRICFDQVRFSDIVTVKSDFSRLLYVFHVIGVIFYPYMVFY